MRRILISIAGVMGVLAVVLQAGQSQSEPSKPSSPAVRFRQDEARARLADRSADEAAIRANIALFVKAYNAGDAKAVAALFTPDGEIEDKDGNTSDGREAIAKTFGELFAAMPKKQLEVSVESIRFIGADLAV